MTAPLSPAETERLRRLAEPKTPETAQHYMDRLRERCDDDCKECAEYWRSDVIDLTTETLRAGEKP